MSAICCEAGCWGEWLTADCERPVDVREKVFYLGNKFESDARHQPAFKPGIQMQTLFPLDDPETLLLDRLNSNETEIGRQFDID